MGAETFEHTGHGETAMEAFEQAKDDALYEYGHSGYTGTLAEKNSFVEITLPDGMDAYDYARTLVDNDDERISDKWGDAGCIKMEDGEFLFFGWASS